VNFLIVEDDPVALSVLSHLLNEYGTVTTAEDGKEGVSQFKEANKRNKKFDAVFLDIMMPNVDGHEVLETIRTLEQEANIHGSTTTKIVMCSALDDSKNIIKAFRNQCEGYLTKPIHKEDVEKKLTELNLL
jgi:two-component system chemotaxis response regulator CheY